MKTSSKQKYSLGARVIYSLMAAIGHLPTSWLYTFSDGLSWLLRRVVGYRRDVLERQIRASFPEKTEDELKILEKEAYTHLSDLMVEYMMLAAFDKKQLHEHVELVGAEKFKALYDQGHKLIYMNLGHVGNWEWFTGFQDFLPFTQMHILYKPVHGVMDDVLKMLRTKFGSEVLDKNLAPRTLLTLNRGEGAHLLIFVADQTPSLPNIHLFTHFMHQETAVFTGVERLARKTKSPVTYLDIYRVERGRYRCEIEVVTDDASQSKPGEISADFMQRLERTIRRHPAEWLWTHRRWKHTPEEVKRERPDQSFIYL